jgi:hypothetical protein
MALSVPCFDVLDRIRVAHDTDPVLRALRDELLTNQCAAPALGPD